MGLVAIDYLLDDPKSITKETRKRWRQEVEIDAMEDLKAFKKKREVDEDE